MRPAAALIPAALLAVAALAGAGCGGGSATSATTAGAGTATATAPAERVRVWFADASGQRLVAEDRSVAAGAGGLQAALAALAEGPVRRDLMPALPAATRVLGAAVAGGTATVDLSQEFAAGYPAGSAGEIATLAPIVVTATAVPGVERVLITVAGAVPDVPGAAFDLSAPLTRADLPAGMRG